MIFLIWWIVYWYKGILTLSKEVGVTIQVAIVNHVNGAPRRWSFLPSTSPPRYEPDSSPPCCSQVTLTLADGECLWLRVRMWDSPKGRRVTHGLRRLWWPPSLNKSAEKQKRSLCRASVLSKSRERSRQEMEKEPPHSLFHPLLRPSWIPALGFHKSSPVFTVNPLFQLH